MRIKSMMKGMLAVVMAMSMAACSGAPAADQTSSESPSPAQTESTAATEQETIYDYKYTSNIYNTYRWPALNAASSIPVGGATFAKPHSMPSRALWP